jgi:hypothetical protein
VSIVDREILIDKEKDGKKRKRKWQQGDIKAADALLNQPILYGEGQGHAKMINSTSKSIEAHVATPLYLETVAMIG